MAIWMGGCMRSRAAITDSTFLSLLVCSNQNAFDPPPPNSPSLSLSNLSQY